MSNKEIIDINPLLLNEDDCIIAYLKGQMTGDEENAFLKDLQENPALKERAIAMARLVKGMKEVGALQDEEIKAQFLSINENHVKRIANNTINRDAKNDWRTNNNAAIIGSDLELFNEGETDVTGNIEETLQNNKKRVSISKIASWLSIAASLFLIVWVGIGYNDYRKTTRLAEEYENVFESPIISRGGQLSETEQKLEVLFNNVSTKTDMDNTLHELSLLWELSIMETYNDYTEYASEIGWYLAIGYLKDNDKKNAQIVLEKLIDLNQEGRAVGNKVRKLLDELL